MSGVRALTELRTLLREPGDAPIPAVVVARAMDEMDSILVDRSRLLEADVENRRRIAGLQSQLRRIQSLAAQARGGQDLAERISKTSL